MGAEKRKADEPATTPAKKPKEEEREKFLAVWAELRDYFCSLLPSYELPEEAQTRIRDMLEYTVPGGKLNRGMTVLTTVKCLVPEDKMTAEMELKANVIGWCIELLQAFFLIADDIMDESITRRGKPCWYRVEGIGMDAINDCLIVESMMYVLLKKYFKGSHCYIDLVELFHEVTLKTEFGQLLDLTTAPVGRVDFSKFTIKQHSLIVKYKTAFYTFYLSMAGGMHLAGVATEEGLELAKKICMEMGEYFQIQDDYLDCYGAPEVIGKIGTDIEDNKCSWLVVQALDRCTPEQRKILEENYAKKDPECVKKVKDLYKELELERIFKEYEEESYKRICGLISEVAPEQQGMFNAMLSRIYKRSK